MPSASTLTSPAVTRVAVKLTAQRSNIYTKFIRAMKRYEVIISEVQYQRLLVEAETEEEAEEKALADYYGGAIGELVFDYDANVSVERVQEVQAPIRLPVVEIRGKWYYRDDRLREYRNVENPHDSLSFGDAP